MQYAPTEEKTRRGSKDGSADGDEGNPREWRDPLSSPGEQLDHFAHWRGVLCQGREWMMDDLWGKEDSIQSVPHL